VNETPRYWFHAKRYGWGWGMPATWEGWAVLIAWLAAITAVGIFVAPRSILWFYVSVIGLVAALVVICWRTGEPPRWRWGD
jgi:hypothetical protein